MGRRRRKTAFKEVSPDFEYNSTLLVAKFINNLMWDGKKTVAQRIFYNALDIMKKKTGEDAYSLFEKAINNVKPVLIVRPRRIGGATYQIPMEVPSYKSISFAIKWIIKAARKRREYRMEERLANELLDAAKGEGEAIKTKETSHKMAEANRAFASFRW